MIEASGRSATRQMALAGFMQAGNVTVYAGSWRHPATEHGFLDQRYYQKLGRTLEDGCFDMMFFDDRLAMAGVYGGSVADAVRLGAPLCDGFVIAATHTPGANEDTVRLVVPELQRRGLFRERYTGTTLRENLGLPRPAVGQRA